MKPHNIFLVRHGESVANVNKNIYKTLPDYAVRLTPKGIEQACVAGNKLGDLTKREPCAVYYSPFYRTRDTASKIIRHVPVEEGFLKEEPRLREQEWAGRLREDGEMVSVQEERDLYGHFNFRFQGGESCADVYDRVSSFFNTLHRDFEKRNFPRHCIIVSHGMTMRLFIMRWFHLNVEEFELLANPKNCEIWHMQRFGSGYFGNKERYRMLSKLRKYPAPKSLHSYPFKEMGLPNPQVLT